MKSSRLPTFHEAYIKVIAKEDNYLHLRFSGGFHPLVTDIKMGGIFKEEVCMENNVNPYEHFTHGHGLGRVQFQTIDRYYIVKLSDSYTSRKLIGWYEGISTEEIAELNANPDNTKVEEHINEYTIYCSNLSFEFTKRQN